MTTPTCFVGAGRSNMCPSRIWWHTSKCSPSVRGAGAPESGAASNIELIGQPAVTDPATTYLMKLRRDCDIAFLQELKTGAMRKFVKKFIRHCASRAPASDTR